MTNYFNKIIRFVRKNWKKIVLGILSILFLLFLSWKIDTNERTSNYFINNIFYIGIVVLILSILLILSSFYNLDFDDDDNKDKRVTKTIIVEKMKTRDSFCDRGSEDLEESCQQLLEEPCNSLDCCAWCKKTGSEKGECIAGDGDGPLFKSGTDGNNYSFDYYYYKNKKIPI